MGLRLGFAVAAFLEPEVLLVDEVLAVGDMKFREKCLGRIGEVSREDGRTVLFVSHDLNAILSTCPRAMLVEGGVLIQDGPALDVVSAYAERQSALPQVGNEFVRHTPHPQFPTPVFTRARVEMERPEGDGHAVHGEAFQVVIETNPESTVGRFGIDILVTDRRQRPVTYVSSVEMQGRYFEPGDVATCAIPFLPLAPGVYFVALLAHLPGVQPFDYWGNEIAFDVLQFDPFGIGSTFTPNDETGSVVPAHIWSLGGQSS